MSLLQLINRFFLTSSAPFSLNWPLSCFGLVVAMSVCTYVCLLVLKNFRTRLQLWHQYPEKMLNLTIGPNITCSVPVSYFGINTLYTLRYTLYTKRYTLHTINYTQYTLYTLHFTLYIIHYTLHYAGFIFCSHKWNM